VNGKTQQELRDAVTESLYDVARAFCKLSMTWERLDSVDQDVLNAMGWNKLVTKSFDEMWSEFWDMALAVETVVSEMKNA
jgi:hypothetical protein